MKTYVVCVSDSSSCDRRTPVMVMKETSLGEVARMAIDEFVTAYGDEMQFPLFVDIHPGDQFAGVKWLHPRAASTG